LEFPLKDRNPVAKQGGRVKRSHLEGGSGGAGSRRKKHTYESRGPLQVVWDKKNSCLTKRKIRGNRRGKKSSWHLLRFTEHSKPEKKIGDMKNGNPEEGLGHPTQSTKDLHMFTHMDKRHEAKQHKKDLKTGEGSEKETSQKKLS